MPPVTGLIVDLAGCLTGIALYVMLAVMVWREPHAPSHATPPSVRRTRSDGVSSDRSNPRARGNQEPNQRPDSGGE
jgi:hypothetical protein